MAERERVPPINQPLFQPLRGAPIGVRVEGGVFPAPAAGPRGPLAGVPAAPRGPIAGVAGVPAAPRGPAAGPRGPVAGPRGPAAGPRGPAAPPVVPPVVPPAAPPVVPVESPDANTYAPVTYAEARVFELQAPPGIFYTETEQDIVNNIGTLLNNNGLNIIRRIYAGYWIFLQNVSDVTARNFTHPGLARITYGIELEFLSSSNRYIISSGANSCMLRQNNHFWKNNINYQNARIAEPGKIITNNPDTFDEWSSYFIQDSYDHGSVSFKGDVICQNIGPAGLRIEDDPSVNFNNILPTQVWSSRAGDNFFDTELLDNGNEILNALRPAGQQFINRNNNPTNKERILNGNYAYNLVDLISTNNETVTQILNNRNLRYPLVNINFRNNAVAPNWQPGRIPFGCAVIDNFINHITSHGSVLFTQPGHGFHLHICEDRTPAWSIDSQPRKDMLIGFVKLFYIFEPFLFSLFPKYRSSSGWCRSYQSIFNFNEIRYSTVNGLWDVLTGVNNVIWTRTNGDYRYIALNFKNCRPGGIGTIEFRIGHSTFDSEFIQAYINLIQNLFNFNLYLDSLNPPGNPCGMQNIYMDIACKLGCFPSYVFQSNASYAAGNAAVGFVNAGNPGRPVSGFFDSLQGQVLRTHVISRQILLLVLLLNNIACMQILIQHINYYHTSQGPVSRFKTSTDLNQIDMTAIQIINLQQNPVNVIQLLANIPLFLNNTNIFYSLRMFSNYLPNVNKFNLHDVCRNCIKNEAGNCYINKYNNGNPLVNGAQRNINDVIQNRDQSRLYYRNCNGVSYYVKSQPELIFKKIFFSEL